SVADRPVAVVFLDLDWFKAVNDAGGHAAGDALLTEVAARLRGSVRADDTVARFGGDEFAALVECGPDGYAAHEVAARLHSALTRPYLLLGARFVVGASIGVAFWRAGASAAELMREADLAMYEAKAGGKGRVVIHGPQFGSGQFGSGQSDSGQFDSGQLNAGRVGNGHSAHSAHPAHSAHSAEGRLNGGGTGTGEIAMSG
ncbi:MAG: diguanylate cyclase domain-containing protein, partial [Actinocrinis sp.]